MRVFIESSYFAVSDGHPCVKTANSSSGVLLLKIGFFVVLNFP